MAFLPATFAINPNFDVRELREDVTKISYEISKIDINNLPTEDALIATELKKNV